MEHLKLPIQIIAYLLIVWAICAMLGMTPNGVALIGGLIALIAIHFDRLFRRR